MAVSRHAGEHSDSSSKRECEAVDESASFLAAAAVTSLVGVAMRECERCNLSARTETLATAANASAARASGGSGGHGWCGYRCTRVSNASARQGR